jgi:hypothetical protein
MAAMEAAENVVDYHLTRDVADVGDPGSGWRLRWDGRWVFGVVAV